MVSNSKTILYFLNNGTVNITNPFYENIGFQCDSSTYFLAHSIDYSHKNFDKGFNNTDDEILR
jgi:hypothetical protein